MALFTGLVCSPRLTGNPLRRQLNHAPPPRDPTAFQPGDAAPTISAVDRLYQQRDTGTMSACKSEKIL